MKKRDIGLRFIGAEPFDIPTNLWTGLPAVGDHLSNGSGRTFEVLQRTWVSGGDIELTLREVNPPAP